MQRMKLNKRSEVIWLLIIGLIILIIIMFLVWMKSSLPQGNPSVGQIQTTPTPADSQKRIEPLPEQQDTLAMQQLQQLQQQQAQAQSVVEQDVIIQPLTEAPKEKPNFVSDTEWQILTAIAQSNPTPERELVRLINSLRFNKQLELWQSLKNSTNQAKRTALASQLLKEIPTRVAQEEMSQSEATQLQQQLSK